MARERLQKIIARAGLASRRKAEELIAAGRVELNGEIVRELGTRADSTRDEIRVDGRVLSPQRPRYLLLNKPRGYLCALSDPFDRALVIDLLGDEVGERVFPAGRLDLDSEGLVLLTNDGALMETITRPGRGVPKVYEVAVEGPLPGVDLERLRAGVDLDGHRTLPCEIERLGRENMLRVTLHEGKKNQIRRMFAAVGTPVVRLVRVALGPLKIGSLEPGEYRDLAPDEVAALRAATVEASETAGTVAASRGGQAHRGPGEDDGP